MSRVPRDRSGANRVATIDPWRVLAPFIAVAAAVTVFAALVIATWTFFEDESIYEVEIVHAAEDEKIDELVEMPKEIPEETPEEDHTAEQIIEDTAVVLKDQPPFEEVLPPVDCSSMIPTIPAPFMPQTVALIASPVTMKTVGGSSRNFGGRQAALRKYGGTGAGEDAVIRGLRYVKSLQLENGSWKHKGEGDATAFALLAFLAHGEDFNSPEFGGTVRHAVEYLRTHHRNNMATYALAEAASVVRTPVLADEASAAVSEMCLRQKERVNANAGGVIPRYCAVMSLVSARMAGLKVPEAERVTKTFIEAYCEMRDNKSGDWTKIKGKGVWHYMIASVCLQYLGCGGETNSKAMLRHLEGVWAPATLGTTEIACCPVRSNYFSTMMFFNEGGETWKRWNDGMIAAYVKTQQVKDGLGWWLCRDQHIGDQPFWTTVYVLHQLMTYYRYLPTNSQEAWAVRPRVPPNFRLKDWIEVEVDI